MIIAVLVTFAAAISSHQVQLAEDLALRGLENRSWMFGTLGTCLVGSPGKKITTIATVDTSCPLS
jgi:hypothetical protein